MLKIWF